MIDYEPSDPMIPFSEKVGSLLGDLYNPASCKERSKQVSDYIQRFVVDNYEDIITDFLTYTFRYSQIIVNIMINTFYENIDRVVLYATNGSSYLEDDDKNNTASWNDIANEYATSGWWYYNMGRYKIPKLTDEDKKFLFTGLSKDFLWTLLTNIVPMNKTVLVDDSIFGTENKFISIVDKFCKLENLHIFYDETITDTPYLYFGITWNPTGDDKMPVAWKKFFEDCAKEKLLWKKEENKS